MRLQTKRLILMPCTEEVVSNANYEIGPHIRGFLEDLREDPTLIGWGPWFVVEKKTNNIVGDIGFKGKPGSNQGVEIGYGITPSSQGKGYATEAVHAIIKWAFTSEDVEKVVAECLDDNIASIKVLEKLKMKQIDIEEKLLKWELYKDEVEVG